MALRSPMVRLLCLFVVAGCGDDTSPAEGPARDGGATLRDAATRDEGATSDQGIDAPRDQAQPLDQSVDRGVDEGGIDADVPDRGMPPGPDAIRNYIFGHSLINHAIETVAPNETAVPHWLGAFARADGRTYSADGQYGFLLQHADLPPTPQWGFDSVPGSWSEGSAFSDANFTTVLLTPANFVQYQPATLPYDGDNPTGASPVSATADIFGWVREQEPGIDVYIYENWPDMDALVGFPPSDDGWQRYNDEVLGPWHAWWLDYHDAVRAALPDAHVHMIPVGPLIAELVTTAPWNEIAVTELYEDGAPHGRPTIYFLAAMVCYQAMYRRDVPEDVDVPSSVHPLVRDALPRLNRIISNYLHGFVDEGGAPRVW